MQPRRRDLSGQRDLAAMQVLLMHTGWFRAPAGGVPRSRERPWPENGRSAWCAAPSIIFTDEVGQRAAAQRWGGRGAERRARDRVSQREGLGGSLP